MHFKQVQDIVLGKVVPLAKQSLPLAKLIAGATATTIDDEAVKAVELGLFIIEDVFSDPDVAKAIEAYLHRNEARLEAIG